MEIRTATIQDVDKVIELSSQLCINEHEYYDSTVDIHFPQNNQKFFKNSISDNDFLVIVAIIEANIVGFLIGSISETEKYRNLDKIAEIFSMFVNPEIRRQGIGNKLVKHFLQWSKDRAKRSKVVVSAPNKRGIEFYRKAGFIEHEIVLERNL